MIIPRINDKIYYYDLLGAAYNMKENYGMLLKPTMKQLNFQLRGIHPNDIRVADQLIKCALTLSNAEKYDSSEEMLLKAYSIISKHKTNTGEILADYYRTYGLLYFHKDISSTDVEGFRNQKYKNYQTAIGYFKKALNAI